MRTCPHCGYEYPSYIHGPCPHCGKLATEPAVPQADEALSGLAAALALVERWRDVSDDTLGRLTADGSATLDWMHDEYDRLCALSVELGERRLAVQAGGGDEGLEAAREWHMRNTTLPPYANSPFVAAFLAGADWQAQAGGGLRAAAALLFAEAEAVSPRFRAWESVTAIDALHRETRHQWPRFANAWNALRALVATPQPQGANE